MAEISLLLVDDEDFFRKSVAEELGQTGYAVDSARNLEEARALLRQRQYHVALLDVRMPDGNGLDLLREIREGSPGTEVIMLTAYGTVEEGVRAMKDGAYDFLTKPCKLSELEAVLEKALQRQTLERNATALEREVQRLQPGARLVGQSPPMRELQRLIARVAAEVHRLSPRSKQPFVVVDCASLHENLLQSELFGHEKGAYTGAISLKHGLFEVADRGTIFLDEIAELTPALQVKLLRVLESGTFRRVGGTVDIRVDVRVIAATNRSLETMMKEGAFREDLYYRLNVFSIHLPALREHPEDIPALIEHFIHNFSIAPKRSITVSEEAMEVLRRYRWPGNVRELKNVIERALILCDQQVIERDHLPMGVRMGPPFGADEQTGALLTLEEAERGYIRRVLDECGGHRQRAATILGISERTLYRKLQELGQAQASS